MISEIEILARINRKEENENLLSEKELSIRDQIERYIKLILEYNQKVNLVSRKITREALDQLIGETLLIDKYITKKIIIDAGSGNGLLGIPIALLNPGKKIVLVESKRKKIIFLEKIKERMRLTNLEVHCSRVEDYLKSKREDGISLVARGFPVNKILFNFLKKGILAEIVLITSENKIKKIKIDMANVNQTTYNVNFRDNLKILKLENVSRET